MSAAHTNELPVPRARGLITALGIGQICSWGSLYYSFPLIAEAMGLELGWSKPQLYGAASVGLILAALLTYPVGMAIDRGHGRKVMSAASLLAALLLALWSQVQSLGTFYLLVAGIGALQAATLYEPAFAVIARRVGPAHARRGITAVTLWGGFASTVFIPLVHGCIEHWGWRTTLLILALINALVCAGAYYAFIRPERDAHAQALAQSTAPENHQVVHAALRNPVFWLLAVAMTAYAIMFSAFSFHMYPMMLGAGLDGTQVVQLIAIIGPIQVVGRVLISMFAGRASMRAVGSAIVLLFPLAFACLAIAGDSFVLTAVFCIVFGSANGIFTIVRGMAVPEMLSRHAYGALNGLLTAPSTLARAAAPLAGAALWSFTASYQGVIVAIIVAAMVLATSFWLAARLSGRRASGLARSLG